MPKGKKQSETILKWKKLIEKRKSSASTPCTPAPSSPTVYMLKKKKKNEQEELKKEMRETKTGEEKQ